MISAYYLFDEIKSSLGWLYFPMQETYHFENINHELNYEREQ